MLPRYRWSDEAVMQFVQLYKSEPVLWDVTDDNYKSKAARSTALKRIAAATQMEDFGVSECRYKIKNLRTHYSQELAKVRNTTQTATRPEEIYKPTLVWFSTMDSFLRPFVTQGADFDGSQMVKRKRIKSEIQDSVRYVQYHDPQQWENNDDQEMMNHSVSKEIEGNLAGQEMESHLLNQESEDNSYSHGIEETSYDQNIESDTFEENTNEPSRVVIPKKRKSANTTLYVDQGIHDYEQFSDIRTNVRETEFDLWARSLAVQLNEMEVTRALELQLKMQTLVSEERLAYERNKVGMCDPSTDSESHHVEERPSQQQQLLQTRSTI